MSKLSRASFEFFDQDIDVRMSKKPCEDDRAARLELEVVDHEGEILIYRFSIVCFDGVIRLRA